MACGEQRSNKEQKKPKTEKPAAAPAAGAMSKGQTEPITKKKG